MVKKILKAPIFLLAVLITYILGLFVKRPKEQELCISWEAGRERIFSFGLPYWKKKLEEFGLVQPGISVLEVGSGNGQWLIAFAEFAKNVVGIEPNDQVREYSKQKIQEYQVSGKIDVTNSPAENIPGKDKSFDVVFCAGVFMFTEQKKALQEFARVLKDGGKVLLTVNGVGYFLMYVLNGMRYFSIKKTYYGLSGICYTIIKWVTGKQFGVCAVSHSEMERLLKKNGFKLVDTRLWLDMDLYPKEHFGFATNYAFIAEKLTNSG